MDIFIIIGREYDSNVYVITGENPTIIDTGTGFHSKVIQTTIKKYVDPLNINQIILTHEHYDHVGGAKDLMNFTKGHAKIIAHTAAAEKLKTGKSTFAEMLGGIMPTLIVDISLSGNEYLLIGDETFQVLATPGHSLGSICLYNQKRKILFSGDTVFADGGFGRYDFPGGDFSALVQSLKELSALDISDLYPGHGSVVEGSGKNHIKKSYKNIQSMI